MDDKGFDRNVFHVKIWLYRVKNIRLRRVVFALFYLQGPGIQRKNH